MTILLTTRGAVVLLLTGLALIVVACGGSGGGTGSSSAPTGASIQAQPNPVPASDGLGTTTVVWSTGDGSQGQVYVSEDGGEDRLFDAGTQGSTQAPWIRAGSTYEFRLFAGSDHKTLLGSVKVSRAK